MNETSNKTDTNDADELAQLAEAGFYKAVRVKGVDATPTRLFYQRLLRATANCMVMVRNNTY